MLTVDNVFSGLSRVVWDIHSVYYQCIRYFHIWYIQHIFVHMLP